jgi:hypothetical protein
MLQPSLPQDDQLKIDLRCDGCRHRFRAMWSARNFVGNHCGFDCPECGGRCGATTWHLIKEPVPQRDPLPARQLS